MLKEEPVMHEIVRQRGLSVSERNRRCPACVLRRPHDSLVVVYCVTWCDWCPIAKDLLSVLVLSSVEHPDRRSSAEICYPGVSCVGTQPLEMQESPSDHHLRYGLRPPHVTIKNTEEDTNGAQ